MRRLAVVPTLLLAACAGYRGGWESVPYVTAAAPQWSEYRTPFEASQRSELALPGITLAVRLENQVQTYDRQVYLYALPVPGDGRDRATRPIQPGTTRVTLRVSATQGDFVFRPRLARLSIGGRTVAGASAHEFGPSIEVTRGADPPDRWTDTPIGDEKVLANREQTYLLSIDFPIDTPSPERNDIALDLSEALVAPGRPAIPLIRFAPVRWKEGYT